MFVLLRESGPTYSSRRRRSTPNLIGPSPARTSARQRGAYSRVGNAWVFGDAAVRRRWGMRVRGLNQRTDAMPTHKDLKRLVRGRMQKTGESYTAARAQLTKTKPAVSNGPPRVPERDYAKVAGMSDAAVKAKTGCTWKKWVDHLDHAKAYEWPHGKIVAHLYEKHEVPGWWAQMV